MTDDAWTPGEWQTGNCADRVHRAVVQLAVLLAGLWMGENPLRRSQGNFETVAELGGPS